MTGECRHFSGLATLAGDEDPAAVQRSQDHRPTMGRSLPSRPRFDPSPIVPATRRTRPLMLVTLPGGKAPRMSRVGFGGPLRRPDYPFS